MFTLNKAGRQHIVDEWNRLALSKYQSNDHAAFDKEFDMADDHSNLNGEGDAVEVPARMAAGGMPVHIAVYDEHFEPAEVL